MSNVPRLHLSDDPNEPGMYEDPDGDYIHYEDYAAAVETLRCLYSNAGLAVAAIEGKLDDDLERYKRDLTTALDHAADLLSKARTETTEVEER